MSGSRPIQPLSFDGDNSVVIDTEKRHAVIDHDEYEGRFSPRAHGGRDSAAWTASAMAV